MLYNIWDKGGKEMKRNFKEEIYNRIQHFNSETVFIASDFFDIAEYETVRKSLNRLTNEEKIKKIANGIYYNPKYIELIGEYEAPSVHQVALAIAKKYNWTIAPSGNTALNMLGLSTQVPAKWTYISDGRYYDFSFGNTSIEFKRRSNSKISKMSTNTAMLIQAIKAIGKEKITDEQISYLKRKLSGPQKEELLKEGKTTSQWIYQIFRRINEVA